jgi:rRNA maturation RNase YbeY
MAGLNERFRGKTGTTDVLSFPMGGQDASCCGAEGEARYLGDIAIDPLRASEQAAEYGHSLDAELRRLVVHGILHLAGYDHETSRAEAARMRRMEERVIKSIGA